MADENSAGIFETCFHVKSWSKNLNFKSKSSIEKFSPKLGPYLPIGQDSRKPTSINFPTNPVPIWGTFTNL